MRKTVIIGLIVAFALVAAVIAVAYHSYLEGVSDREIEKTLNMSLSDYPQLFEKDVVIVIGDNASQLEKESAESIARYLENSTGNKPEIISAQKIDSFKYTYNLIIVGTPNSNNVLKRVCDMADVTMVTEEYPGGGKGVLEILRSPWNEEKAILLVEGSDEWGLKAGVEMLDETKGLNTSSIFTNWSVNLIFIEHRIDIHSELIEGNYSVPFIDKPTYYFDERTGNLHGLIDFDVNDTLKIIYGRLLGLRGIGGGATSSLYGVYELPYEHSDRLHRLTIISMDPNGLTILSTEPNGTIYLSYGNNSIILKSREEWMNITSTIDVQQYGSAKRTITDRIINHGILPKSKIGKWGW